MNRRDFIKLNALLAASSVLPINLFGSGFNDYKALVIILLHGGNDSLNMFIPTNVDKFEEYSKARGILAIKNNKLELPISNGKLALEAGENNPYYDGGTIVNSYTKGFYDSEFGIGINPLMPELAYLAKEGNLAVVSNMGTLHEPTTKEDIAKKRVKLPIYLYSHNSQRALFYTGNSQNQSSIGWAGHLADIWGDVNNSSVYGLNIAIDSAVKMLYGKDTNPLVISNRGPTRYSKVKDEERILYDKLLQINSNNDYKRLYNKLKKSSFKYQDTLNDDWDSVTLSFNSTNGYGDELFTKLGYQKLGVKSTEVTGFGLMDKLKAVTKLIQIGKNRGFNREIFFITQGGYDTHGNQKVQHARLLRELSCAMYDFNMAIKDLGLSDSVTTFNISDFGRSAGNNGNGSDHAWGGHYFVLGGAVKGGLYGELPSLELGGIDDATKKGRLIPKISHTQYYSTILNWFGVDEATTLKLFPELSNFSNKNLGFMKV